MMWVLVENCDMSIDIVCDTTVVTDADLAIGEMVTVLYPDPKKKKKLVEYAAKIIDISEDKDFLEGQMTEMLANAAPAVDEPKVVGRKLNYTKASKKVQGKDKNENAAAAATAKFILGQMEEIKEKAEKKVDPDAETNAFPASDLADHNELRKIRKENARLRRERDDALEIRALLTTAQQLVDRLKSSPSSKFREANVPEDELTWSPGSGNTVVAVSEPKRVFGSETPRLERQNAFYGVPVSPNCSQLSPAVLPTTKSLKFSRIDDQVSELMPGCGVYVPASAIAAVRRSAKNPSSAARQLMDSVFTEDALTVCSVKGGLAKGPHIGKPSVRRDALDLAGVEAILAFVADLSKSMGWKDFTVTNIIRAMGTKLSELRSRSAPAASNLD